MDVDRMGKGYSMKAFHEYNGLELAKKYHDAFLNSLSTKGYQRLFRDKVTYNYQKLAKDKCFRMFVYGEYLKKKNGKNYVKVNL